MTTRIKKFSEMGVSENLEHHINGNISVLDNLFRPGSQAFFDLIEEARNHKDLLLEVDRQLFIGTDIGTYGLFEGKRVPLDIPMEVVDEDEAINEAEYRGRKVKLNHPTRSSGPKKKKYKVYVKNPDTGNVIQVNFGDVSGGLKAKVSDPKARKKFAARHKCAEKKDKTTPGYWACRINRYPHLWSSGKAYPGFW